MNGTYAFDGVIDVCGERCKEVGEPVADESRLTTIVLKSDGNGGDERAREIDITSLQIPSECAGHDSEHDIVDGDVERLLDALDCLERDLGRIEVSVGAEGAIEGSVWSIKENRVRVSAGVSLAEQ